MFEKWASVSQGSYSHMDKKLTDNLEMVGQVLMSAQTECERKLRCRNTMYIIIDDEIILVLFIAICFVV